MAKNCIGLDIGSSSVKVVWARETKKGVVLHAFGREPLPPQTIVDGTIMNQGAIAQAIRTLWQRHKLKQKEVAVAISGHSVIIKKILVPPMTDDELAEQIPWEAPRHIPFDKTEVELDYRVTNRQTPSGQMELVLVAAKKEVVHDYAAVVREAGLVPHVVDVVAFAVQRAFLASYPTAPGETVVIVNVGAAISNINIVRDGASMFSRDVTIGGNALTEEIQRQLGVTQEEAEAYKVDGGGPAPREVERIIESVAEVMAGEFQRSLDFFLATSADSSVNRIYLSGGSARVGALHRAIERRSRLPVEVVDPWRKVALEPGPVKLDPIALHAQGAEAMAALGLALRAPTDINLLQEKKPRRPDRGTQSIYAGFFAVLVSGFLVYFFVHQPLADEIGQLQSTNARLQRQNRQLQEETKDFDVIKQQFEAVKAQNEAIQRLQNARAVPAWLLVELSTILTKDRRPTMTPEMAERVRTDPNRQWSMGWDPKRVWIESFEESGGRFTLRGGAQSDSDVTQLAMRVQASAYFTEVVQPTGNIEVDQRTRTSFYRFIITGKVAY